MLAHWNQMNIDQTFGRVETLLRPVATLCGREDSQDPRERMAARRLQIAVLRKADNDVMQEARRAAEKRKSTAQDKSTQAPKSERFAFRADPSGEYFWHRDVPTQRVSDPDAPPKAARYTVVRVVQCLQCGGEGSSFLCYDAADAEKKRMETELHRWAQRVRINDTGLPKSVHSVAGLEGHVQEERSGSRRVGFDWRRSMWISTAHFAWLPPPGTEAADAGGGPPPAAADGGSAIEAKSPPAAATATLPRHDDAPSERAPGEGAVRSARASCAPAKVKRVTPPARRQKAPKTDAHSGVWSKRRRSADSRVCLGPVRSQWRELCDWGDWWEKEMCAYVCAMPCACPLVMRLTGQKPSACVCLSLTSYFCATSSRACFLHLKRAMANASASAYYGKFK